MKNSILSAKQMIASSMLLGVLIAASAGQAPAVEAKGELSSKEVKALVVSASTPADHLKLAQYYSAMAAKHDAEAQEHEALVVAYTQNPQLGASNHPMAPNTSDHCKYFAAHCRKAANEMRAMADAHEAMAKSLSK